MKEKYSSRRLLRSLPYIGKTKVMRANINGNIGSGHLEESEEYPSGVCRPCVGTNFLKRTGCVKWIHKRC